ncbi:MAG: hypothetical protein CMJ98_05760 [Planctomycetes bacterium]|nr:hypothetical protein [Planctomycetota bacterium]
MGDPRQQQGAGDDHPHHGPHAHRLGLPEADQKPLVKAPIRDGPAPRCHQHQPETTGFDRLHRRIDEGNEQDVVERRERNERVQERERHTREGCEALQAPEGLAVCGERGRGREHHDDRRLDQQRDRKDDAAERGEVMLGIG